jgi:hypothetical protein
MKTQKIGLSCAVMAAVGLSLACDLDRKATTEDCWELDWAMAWLEQ